MQTPLVLLDARERDPDLPEALSRRLAELHAASMSCAQAAQALLAIWPIPEALGRACLQMAALADGSGRALAYHNPAHTLNVAAGWANLAMLHGQIAARDAGVAPLAAADLGLGLIAAFGHDVGHDGMGNARPVAQPFRLEMIAARAAADVMRGCGLAQAAIDCVTAAILCTEPEHGFAALARARLGQDITGSGAFRGGLERPAAQLIAALLRDADLLASIALTAADHDRQSRLLGEEIGADLCVPASAERLFRRALRENFTTPAGALFRPQLERLLAANARRAAAGQAMSLAEAEGAQAEGA